MGSNSDIGQLVQLGSWDVWKGALAKPGASWEGILAGRLGDRDIMPRCAPEDFPISGWRVVHTAEEPWAEKVLILAAPSASIAGRWVLIQLAGGREGWWLGGPASHVPVPVREVRRQGLHLKWARDAFLVERGSTPDATVELLNVGDRVWEPTEEDRRHVQGMVLDLQGEQLGTGWYAHGLTDQLPALMPGARVTLPVSFNHTELQHLSPGNCLLAANLSSLHLWTGTRAALRVM